MVVSKREAMAPWRAKTLQLLLDVAGALMPLNERMLSTCCARVLYLVKGYNLAFMACMADATEHPDKFLVRHFLRGFPVYGNITICCERWETACSANRRGEGARQQPSVEQGSAELGGVGGLKAVRDRGSESWQAIEAVWESTCKELAAGWTVGIDTDNGDGRETHRWRGFLPGELHKHPWVGHNGSCRYIRRFGVYQNGATRPNPDKFLVRHFLRGFPVYGNITICCERWETACSANRRGEGARQQPSVEQGSAELGGVGGLKAVRDRGSESWKAIEAVWESTCKELAAGSTVGIDTDNGDGRIAPLARLRARRVTQAPVGWSQWVVWYIRRFGVYQNGATRPIDDCTEQGDNSITGGQDKLTLIRADMPIRVSQYYALARVRWERELQRRGKWAQLHGSAVSGEVEAFEVATDDAKKAFRRVPTAEVQVVCVLNPVLLRAELVMLPGFVFGCLSAVMAWNRYSHYATHVGRRALAVPVTAYFDDFQIYGPPWDAPHAQRDLGALLNTMIGFDAAKHLLPDQIRVVLGVESDFSRLPLDMHVRMAVSEERMDKLRVTLRGLLREASMSHATGVRVYGKCRWVLCPRFGRIYLAALHPLRQVRSGSSFSPQPDVAECLTFLLRILDVLRPVSVHVFPVRCEEPILVFSDASYKTQSRIGELGVVVWCPARRRLFCAGARLPAWALYRFEYLCKQMTYICQAELYAALCAWVTFPDLLRGRLVHHFIDNKAAEAGMVKGTSPAPASARILLEYYVQVFRLQCQPWVSFVYSEDNIADLPSRGDFALLMSLGAERRRMVFPTLRRFIFH
eukprot:CAMPEP_0183379174 /NCGR_PEP_ID=MMETSP0164_2-20130417/125291_1 /TAXON_ID=221442 /ORGANISM="Coccolithus pelagicus ssp braarudi, Strain PLY182g" /LENGTH=806 /DNA_ID=CAMNT_0025556753 /DNA_START=1 /DNA_END=2424 /DNA_ORIENTATION=+